MQDVSVSVSRSTRVVRQLNSRSIVRYCLQATFPDALQEMVAAVDSEGGACSALGWTEMKSRIALTMLRIAKKLTATTNKDAPPCDVLQTEKMFF